MYPVHGQAAAAVKTGVAARALSAVPVAGAPRVAAIALSDLQIFVCKHCKCRGKNRTQCGICGKRNCMVVDAPGVPANDAATPEPKRRGNLAAAIASGSQIVRRKTGIPKLDKVLGGGFVDKSAILLAGDPGAGKSTLLMQTCAAFAGHRKIKNVDEEFRALYCTGEEALEQVGARAARIPHALEKGEWIELIATTNVPEIMGAILDYKPHLVIVDSIQEVGDEALMGRFGGENQVSNAIRSVMKCVREVGHGTAIFVCHVRKDGDFAGAKKAEHLVDVTCKLSYDPREEDEDEDEDEPKPRGKKKKKRADEIVMLDERVLEAHKNRYGSITEVSVFTMTDRGLR